MKAVSQLMIVILLLLIGIMLTFSLYLWSRETVEKVYPNQEHTYQRSRACLSIDKIESGFITIKNCGLVPLKNLVLYVDDQKIMELTGIELDPQQTHEFSNPVTGEGHVYFVTSDLAESPHVKK
ncbi:MAG: hypothetical protein J7K26_00495 [Candidatus Aenigmarchaeota archaeon]|nr:hypothetical protein [Candidatus Aenigmarchaeota archaeon]